MSSPETMDELTGDSNIQNTVDDKSDKSRDSAVSPQSSKVSGGDPMEPNEAVLDFEVDAPEPNRDEHDGAPEIHDELSKEGDVSNDGEISDDSSKSTDKKPEEKKPKVRSSDLEDGEVTDSDEDGEAKPAPSANGASEPKGERPPVCRFFSRGQCTWGTQCRFIHPGVPTGGSSGFYAHAPHPRIFNGPGGHFPPPNYPPAPSAPVETAWERGLRTAKELLKEASRRREEDPAFEDRKLHQGLQGSPSHREPPVRFSPSPSPPPRSKLYGTYEKHRTAQRSVSPLDVDRWREERHAAATKVRSGAGDGWRDPWMRAKSPGRRPRRRGRSSTSRSCSSSASSRSSFSSSKSSSRSRSRDRDRRGGRPGKARMPRQRYPSERGRQFVASPSPSRYRGHIAPPPGGPGRVRRRTTSSGSSTSRSKSPPGSQARKRPYSRSKSPDIPRRPRPPSPSGTVAPQIRMNLIDKSRKLTGKRAFSVSPSPPGSPKATRVSPSPPPRSQDGRSQDSSSKKRPDKKSEAVKREELMKQLRAVEDAIAKKKART